MTGVEDLAPQRDDAADRGNDVSSVGDEAPSASSTGSLIHRMAMRPRRVLVKAHRWGTMILMVPLAIVVVTGAVLVFRYTFDDWMHSELYQHGDGDVGVSAVLASVEKELPGSTVNNVLAPANTRGVYVVDVSVSGGQVGHHGGDEEPTVQRHVFVDPATGAVNGVHDPNAGLLFWIDRGHAAFWQEGGILGVDAPGGYCQNPKGIGHPICTVLPDGGDIIGWVGIGWIALALSGFYLWYWPGVKRWARAVRVRRSRGAFTFNLDLHKALGVTVLLPALVIAWTGAQIGFPLMQNLFERFTPAHRHLETIVWSPPDEAWTSTAADGDVPVGADQVVASLREAHPAWTVESMAPPGDETGVWMVWVNSGAYTPYQREVNKGDVMVLVDQYSAEVHYAGSPSAGNVFDQAYGIWYWPLHTGEFLGIPTRLLWGVFGIVPVVLAVTGLVMNRIRAKKTAANGNPILDPRRPPHRETKLTTAAPFRLRSEIARHRFVSQRIGAARYVAISKTSTTIANSAIRVESTANPCRRRSAADDGRDITLRRAIQPSRFKNTTGSRHEAIMELLRELRCRRSIHSVMTIL